MLREDLHEDKEANLNKVSKRTFRLHLTCLAERNKTTPLPKTVPKGFTHRCH